MSLKWLGIKDIQLDTVKLPVGHAKRKKEAHVKDLAESIERSGVIALPVVRVLPDKTRALVAGGDRFAALQLLKFVKHEVRLVSGTDEEMEVLTIEENLTRRRGDNYDALASRLVEITTGKVQAAREEAKETAEDEEPAEEPKRKPGRPKSAKAEAREEVAEQLGRSPEAIRAAEKRAKKEKTEEPVGLTPMAPPIDTFDLELPEAVVNGLYPKIRVVQEALREAGRKVDGALRRLTMDLKFEDSAPVYKLAYDRTYESVQQAADNIRRAVPEMLCPWCKFAFAIRPDCTGCAGVGLVSKDTAWYCPPELLKRGPEAMVTNGRGGYMLLAAPAEKPTKGKKSKGIRVEDANGNDIAPAAEPAPAPVAEELF